MRFCLLSVVILLPAACSREKDAVPTSDPAAALAPSATTHSGSATTPVKHTATPSRQHLSQSCESVCAVADKLGCKRAKACQQNCAVMATTGVCDRELGAFYECLKTQPSEHWECLEDGTAAIREGYCEGEQAQARRSAWATLGGPPTTRAIRSWASPA
jgi:hypothetical protein